MTSLAATRGAAIVVTAVNGEPIEPGSEVRPDRIRHRVGMSPKGTLNFEPDQGLADGADLAALRPRPWFTRTLGEIASGRLSELRP